MNNNEAYFFYRMLNDPRKSNPFSLNCPRTILVTHNISTGFWNYGESDIIAIDNQFHIYEGEIKVSIQDFKKDFKKNPEILEERKAKLTGKYYIFPEEMYLKYEKEIFDILVKFNQEHKDFCCGIVSVGNTIDFKFQSCIRYNNPKLDYRLDLVSFAKLVRLTCFRQFSPIEKSIQEKDIENLKIFE